MIPCLIFVFPKLRMGKNETEMVVTKQEKKNTGPNLGVSTQ